MPLPFDQPRAWRVTLKSSRRDEAPEAETVHASKLEATGHFLIFKRWDEMVVRVIPFGAFADCVAVDPASGDVLYAVRRTADE